MTLKKKNNVFHMRYADPMVTPKGRLKVEVFNTGVGKPLENAQVDIFTVDQNGEQKQIEALVTDNSGQTLDILLEAPSKEYSFTPESEVRPYSLYTIKISANDFRPTTIENVEIFEDTTAIQDVNMVPAESPIETSQNIVIQDNTLWGDFPPKIPEDEVKELPPPTGFVVLDEPVIPEFIVVHDGTPNSNAPNYYVPFKDYIKNVASSEIYSTWHETTIRANVLAIISFTLNRVFTEWYRGQGKNFTITSSTAFDQAFSYGRNIFEEISTIVDDVFSTYVTRTNIAQPLLTQYCDGRTASCPNWMSQWGSQGLGSQGYSTMDILRHYYGDIYLDQATLVSGVPVSYPNQLLQVGSSGSAVRTIQTQLNAISNNYPAIPKLRVDGSYGPATLESVKKFQSIFNMPQTGMVDFATWYQISHIYVAVTRLAQLV